MVFFYTIYLGIRIIANSQLLTKKKVFVFENGRETLFLITNVAGHHFLPIEVLCTVR